MDVTHWLFVALAVWLFLLGMGVAVWDWYVTRQPRQRTRAYREFADVGDEVDFEQFLLALDEARRSA